jgi:hypothetical protein
MIVGVSNMKIVSPFIVLSLPLCKTNSQKESNPVAVPVFYKKQHLGQFGQQIGAPTLSNC